MKALAGTKAVIAAAVKAQQDKQTNQMNAGRRAEAVTARSRSEFAQLHKALGGSRMCWSRARHREESVPLASVKSGLIASGKLRG
jgi:hypothetical protein